MSLWCEALMAQRRYLAYNSVAHSVWDSGADKNCAVGSGADSEPGGVTIKASSLFSLCDN